MRRRVPFVLTLGLVAGCALRGDVRKVELQVAALRGDQARSDSTRAAERDSIVALVRAVQQALVTQQAYLVQLRGDLRTELLSVQQQLVSVQELTGQSQQRLTELRTRIESRAQQPEPVLPAPGGVPTGASGNPAGPGPDPPAHRPRPGLSGNRRPRRRAVLGRPPPPARDRAGPLPEPLTPQPHLPMTRERSAADPSQRPRRAGAQPRRATWTTAPFDPPDDSSSIPRAC